MAEEQYLLIQQTVKLFGKVITMKSMWFLMGFSSLLPVIPAKCKEWKIMRPQDLAYSFTQR